ncbi:hypothetical protein LPTSP4_03520 [Leptospira ryugenii]|uniref:Uncharacterized protein n=1 Tax=Leptospira ryugenii TaxID=1917863 RepID=A0A2P2DW39_9LEPT|nr:glycosyltransferase family 4 protein [Leptospira ryugenii]GBF48852.1 hypothetical protein LPTSP4_03520 [Leptospira ryugenii]
MKILILTYRMAMGFGVDVVVGETARRFVKKGLDVTIGVIDQEPGVYADLNIRKLDSSNPVSKSFLIATDPDVIIIHTFPFFEQIDYLKDFAPVIFWEHGDPSPELQVDPGKSFLANEKLHKATNGYPKANGIISISEFIASEIGEFDSKIIYNGSEHIPLFEKQKKISGNNKLRVGVLNRIGPGENRYKGIERYENLIQAVHNQDSFQFCFAGRGREEDAQALISQNIEVRLNLSEEEKLEYLKGLDVFISFSLWEGFNLPLVEAARLGNVCLAFDTGAHPEVCPFVFENVESMAKFLDILATNNGLLNKYSKDALLFVSTKFNWDRAADQAFQYLREVYLRDTRVRNVSFMKRLNILYHFSMYYFYRLNLGITGSVKFLKEHGYRDFVLLLKRKIASIFFSLR